MVNISRIKVFALPLALALLSLISAQTAIAQDSCPKGAVFSPEGNDNEIVITRHGIVDLQLGGAAEGVTAPHFAIEVVMPNGDPAYAYGVAASSTYLTNLLYLTKEGVVWHDAILLNDGSFFRFLRDDGTEYFTAHFVSCWQ